MKYKSTAFQFGWIIFYLIWLAICVVLIQLAFRAVTREDKPRETPPTTLHRAAIVASSRFDPEGRTETTIREPEPTTTEPPTTLAPVTSPPRTTPITTAPDPEPRVGGDLGSFRVTCYQLRGTTASGEPVSDEVVAVDPRVIPLHTHLLLDGIGERTALDTGGAIKGHILDLWKSDCSGWPNPTVEVHLVDAEGAP